MRFRCVIHVTRSWDYASDFFDSEEKALAWKQTHWKAATSYTIERGRP